MLLMMVPLHNLSHFRSLKAITLNTCLSVNQTLYPPSHFTEFANKFRPMENWIFSPQKILPYSVSYFNLDGVKNCLKNPWVRLALVVFCLVSSISLENKGLGEVSKKSRQKFGRNSQSGGRDWKKNSRFNLGIFETRGQGLDFAKPQQQQNTATTQPQHCTWGGHENDCAHPS